MPGFIIDLDGTLYAGTNQIPEALPFIEFLQTREYPYKFVTNNSSRKPEDVARHLAQIAGIPAEAHDVLTSSQSAARYISEIVGSKRVFMIGAEGLQHALTEAGIEICTGLNSHPDTVVQGIDVTFNYQKLAEATHHILQGAAYVLTNPDLQLPTEKGLTPGAGSLSAALQASSGKEPIVIGKPSPIIMNDAIRLLDLPADDIWVVGDNLRTDIKGGVVAGCRTAWIRTGVGASMDAELLMNQSGIRPDLVCSHLMEFIRHLEEEYQ